MRNLTIRNEGIDFASNDYLGFSKLMSNPESSWTSLPTSCPDRHHAHALQHVQRCHRAPRFPSQDNLGTNTCTNFRDQTLGSTGSRLLTGNSCNHEELEKEIAEYHQGETALLFTSGYTANLGVISALAQRGDVVLYDTHIHASIRDGLRLSYAKSFAWRHNDLNHLEALLKKHPRSYVAAESIYSIDGSRAPKELEELCERYEALLILDEAHALGLFPPRQAFARIYTFSKALGLFGAAVVGSSLLRNSLINFSRPFIYTTSFPHYHLEAIRAGYDHLRKRTDLAMKLHSLMKHAKLSTPIRAIPHPEPKKEARRLALHGFQVNALLPPTSEPLLRISLHAFNTKEEYDSLCIQL